MGLGPRWLFVRTASRRQDGRGSSFYPIVCCSGQVLGQLLMTQSSWPCCHLGRMIRTALWVTCGASSIHLFASHSLPLGTDIWTDQLFEGFQSTLLVSPRMVRRRPVNRSTNNYFRNLLHARVDGPCSPPTGVTSGGGDTLVPAARGCDRGRCGVLWGHTGGASDGAGR